MRKTKVHVVEVVQDADLRRKEAKARAVVKRFFPNAGPVRLYRTAEGRVGCQLDLTVTAGDRKRLDQAYEAIMEALGERRGRPRGVRKVQTKLMLARAHLPGAKARGGSVARDDVGGGHPTRRRTGADEHPLRFGPQACGHVGAGGSLSPPPLVWTVFPALARTHLINEKAHPLVVRGVEP